MLFPSNRAPNLFLGSGVELADVVSLGANVTIHEGTIVRNGARIQDGAVVGKPLTLGRHSTAPREVPPPAIVDRGATVGTGAVVVRGASIGEGAIVADQAHVRERATIGRDSVIGRGAAVDNDVTVGDRVRVQTGGYLTGWTVVEDDVFVAPGVCTTNDNTMLRAAPGTQWIGATLRRACRVGAGAILLPGIEIGEEAFVAAGAIVTRDVEPRTLVMGTPARAVGEVADEDLLEQFR